MQLLDLTSGHSCIPCSFADVPSTPIISEETPQDAVELRTPQERQHFRALPHALAQKAESEVLVITHVPKVQTFRRWSKSTKSKNYFPEVWLPGGQIALTFSWSASPHTRPSQAPNCHIWKCIFVCFRLVRFSTYSLY